jgi:hypothetical protein
MLALLALLVMYGSRGHVLFDQGRGHTDAGERDLLAVRFAIASVALALRRRRVAGLHLSRTVVVYGALLGLLYGAAQILQTTGLAPHCWPAFQARHGLYVVRATADGAHPATPGPVAHLGWLRYLPPSGSAYWHCMVCDRLRRNC